MAGIDKLYVEDYYSYDMLRKWAIVYYPELLFYFYNTELTYEKYEEKRDYWVDCKVKDAIKAMERLGQYETKEEAAHNLIDYYIKNYDYEYDMEQAMQLVKDTEEEYEHAMTEDLKYDYTFPVMNTPPSVDRKLKWICPVPWVREYLHKQCGVNPRWEWLYRLFWRGKKHFYI